MRPIALLALAVCFSWLSAATAQEKPAEVSGKVSFTKQVAPVLVKKCQVCHGAKDPKGGYRLHTFEMLLTEGDSVAAPVTGGDLEDSELYRLITEEDKSQRMPKDADPLAANEIALIKQWISEGAHFDGPDAKAELATLIPRTPHPQAPKAYRVPVPITAVAFSPDGKELAVGGYHEITIWNPADGKLLRRIGDVAQRTYGLAYSADGSLLAAASGTPGQLGEVRLFDPAGGSLLKDLGAMSDVAFDVAFNPAGDRLAACSADRSIRIYSVADGNEELVIEDHADWVMSVAWSQDGTRLASASRDKTSKIFDTKTGDSLTTYPGHGQSVFGVAFSADGKQVFTGGGDKKIHVWNPADGKKAAEIGGFGHEVYQVLRQEGNLFACSADKTARQFDAAKRNQIRSLSGHADWVYTLSAHAESKRLATGSYDGEVRLWNLADGKSLVQFKAAPGYPPSETAKAE